MSRIPDDDLDRLKKNVSILELCRSRSIELKKQGRRDYVGRCPFHDDKTPSFVVTPDKNLFHCLGCEAAGSVVDLVMKLDGLTFREAVDQLLPGLRGAAAPRPPKRPALAPEKIDTLLERTIAIYQQTFAEASEGRDYLASRGITDGGLFVKHRVGYANGSLKDLLPKDGQLKEELQRLGILLDNGQERFAGCVVFPVLDPDARIVTLYGRYIGGRSSKGGSASGGKRHLFLPDRSTGLWNAVAMKTYPDILLVESVIDALSVMMAGQPNVIAMQGTNGIHERDAACLREHGVQQVTLLPDGDEAGKKAGQKLHEMLSSSLGCRLLCLPDEQDPNSFLQAHGPAKLNEWINATEPGSEPAEASAPNGPDADRPSGETGQAPPVSSVTCGMRRYEIRGLEKGSRRLKATIRIEHGGKLHVDTLDLYSARSRRALAVDLCRIFDEVPETIEGDISKLLRHCEQMEEKPQGVASAVSEPISAAEKKEAEAFGRSPTLFDDILSDCQTRGLMGEHNNVLLLYVAMTSRKRDTPLSVLTLSSSGAGKTALQDAVLAFCPPEDLVKLTSLSGKALFYKDQHSLKHKVLALEEGDGAEDAMYAIRNLISAGELISESTIKDLGTGRLTTMENKVEGPSSVCFTTTKPGIDPETKSRFWVTSIDESRDQTRAILAFQREQHRSDGLITSPEIEVVLKKHRNFQRLLKPLAVKNPFAEQLSYGDDRLQGRRDQPKYLNLIKAIAFLRQMQKEIFYEQRNGSAMPYINVDPDDVALANRLAHEILGHSLDELSRPSRDLLPQLAELVESIIEQRRGKDQDSKPSRMAISFSRRDIREFTGWTNTRLHIHLKELVDFEYVVIESGRNGMPYRYRLVYEGQGTDGHKFLLGLTDPDRLEAPA